MLIVKNSRKILCACFLVLTLSACNEGNDSIEKTSSEMIMNEIFFKETFVDESVDEMTLVLVKKLVSKDKLISAVSAAERFMFFNYGKPHKDFLVESKAENLIALAIWANENEVTLSILARKEWHVSLDKRYLDKGNLKVVFLTSIDPATGIE